VSVSARLAERKRRFCKNQKNDPLGPKGFGAEGVFFDVYLNRTGNLANGAPGL
jgi:hypothetical protein